MITAKFPPLSVFFLLLSILFGQAVAGDTPLNSFLRSSKSGATNNSIESPGNSISNSSTVEAGYDKKLYFNVPSQELRFTLQGRVQLDYHQSHLAGEMQENNAEVRRTWITLTGSKSNWFYLSRVDLGDDAKLATFIEYRGFGENAWLSFGRHKEPFGMSWSGSIKNVTLPERSAISDRYTQGRNVGFMSRGKISNVYYRLGVFEDEQENRELAAEKLALTGRVFRPFIDEENNLVHIGVGFSLRDEMDVYGLEFASVMGRWHIQSEYMREKYMRGEVRSGEVAEGLYFETGWFFTADYMRYKNGVFSEFEPASARGALQLVGRWDSGDGDYSDIELGAVKARSFSVGLNYYASYHVKASLSYTVGEEDSESHLDGDELRFRLQYIF